MACLEKQGVTIPKVATILNLSVTPSLIQVVKDYFDDPSLSLLGEADAAREWIDDPQRNRKGKPMSVGFFRNWLKRERQAILHRGVYLSQNQHQATGTTGRPASSPQQTPLSQAQGGIHRNLMNLEAEYQQASERGSGR